MSQRGLGRRGQNTVEYLMMVSVVVGVVLIGGSMLKRFMPSLFGGVQDMIAGAATEEAGGGADGGTASGSKGSGTGGATHASGDGSGDEGAVAASGTAGADGATSTQEPGHGHAHGPPPHH